MIHPYYKTPYLLRLRRSGELVVIIFYLAAGLVTSATDYALFFVFYNIVPTGLLVATIIAYIGGLLVSFGLSRFWVFRKNARGERFGTSVWRYLALLAVNLLITYGMLWALQAWFGLTPLLGKFVVWTYLTFWNYAANKYWVFKGPRLVKNHFYFARQRRKHQRRRR
jgi:putative flippase GtrA